MKLVTRTGRHGKGKRRMEIGGSVTDARENWSIVGAPTLEVDVNDPEWSILQAPLLDLNVDGKLDHVEVDYEGTWYRLVKLTPQDNDLALTFEDRVVGILREYKGPLQKRRTDAYTRAMFIHDLVREANADGHDIKFYCPNERATQPEVSSQADKVTDNRPGKHTAGVRGFAHGAGRKLGLDRSQLKNLEASLGIAVQLGAPRRAQLALIEAEIVESNIRNLPNGDRDSVGILQVRVSTSGSRKRSLDIGWCVTHFLVSGFWGHGGAIHLARTTSKSSGEIAQLVQGSAYPSRYNEHQTKAKQILSEYHGDGSMSAGDGADGGSTVTVEKAYDFARLKGEDSWDCMNRLAGEVEWKVFVTEGTVYYMSEEDMYRQRPRHVLRRDSAALTNFGFDWDQGKHISTLSFDILNGRWFALVGETVEITGAGPADQRWIVAEAMKSRGSATTTVTLNAVSAPRKEPAPETETLTVGGTDGSATGTSDTRFDALVAACKVVSRRSKGYIRGAQHGRLSSVSPGGYFDCSSAVSYVLWKAGLFNSDSAQVSGWIADHWGRPGTGKTFTVWASVDHVFIEFNRKIKRFDTSPHEAGRLGPRVRHSHRSHGGFTPRHFPGL